MKHDIPRPEDLPALAAYVDLIRAWAPRLDLVAPGDLDRLWDRHVHDCLRLVGLAAEAPPGPAADVGSGAGLPGVVLAIAGPPRHWRLIEPRRLRAAFLEEVVRELGLDCRVVVATAEEAARDPELAAAHALVTARAVAPPAEAFAAALPLVAPGGVAAVVIGTDAEIPRDAGLWAPGIATIRRGSASE